MKPQVSIIMPCYNGAKFLAESIRSVIDQVFTDWELIVVNDGSTDASEEIARQYSGRESRITVKTKDNGGYVSARLHGLRFISDSSRFLLFFDADDILHPNMISRLLQLMVSRPELGAAYCNHMLIDVDGNTIGMPQHGTRLQPTLFGVSKVSDEELYTSFITIFCWASRMIEPMTLIRRKAYEESSGWDIRFGKGRGNIGDGVLLFSEIALTWKIAYLHETLYYYRKHPEQATADPSLNRIAGRKVLSVWRERILPGYKFSNDIKAAIIAYKFRIEAFKKMSSLKHSIRYNPVKALALMGELLYKYILSLQLLFYRHTKVFDI